MSFIQFGADDSVISSQLITAPLWSRDFYALTASFSSSAQQVGVSGKYYLMYYDKEAGCFSPSDSVSLSITVCLPCSPVSPGTAIGSAAKIESGQSASFSASGVGRGKHF